MKLIAAFAFALLAVSVAPAAAHAETGACAELGEQLRQATEATTETQDISPQRAFFMAKMQRELLAGQESCGAILVDTGRDVSPHKPAEPAWFSGQSGA